MPLDRDRKIRVAETHPFQPIVYSFILTYQYDMIQLTRGKTDVFLLSVCVSLPSPYTPALFLLCVLLLFGLNCVTLHILPFSQPSPKPLRPRQTINVDDVLSSLCQPLCPLLPHRIYSQTQLHTSIVYNYNL